TYFIRFKPDESVKYSITMAENNDAFAKFKISGTASNPMFSEVAEHKLSFATTAPMFHFPLILSSNLPDKGVIFGKRTASLIANVHNEGSVSIGMRIIFKANGTLVNPSLINVDTLQEFKINKTLVADEEIEINTNIGRKNVRGRIGNEKFINYYMYKDIDSSWLQLEVGDNLFRYNAEEGIDNLEVFVYFNNQFLEVQECY
ncbi:MAG: phage tail family protein, partial [Bacteroidales bacterium]|nr:phage tail family protein [Bacteroidales bacterium]